MNPGTSNIEWLRVMEVIPQRHGAILGDGFHNDNVYAGRQQSEVQRLDDREMNLPNKPVAKNEISRPA